MLGEEGCLLEEVFGQLVSRCGTRSSEMWPVYPGRGAVVLEWGCGGVAF